MVSHLALTATMLNGSGSCSAPSLPTHYACVSSWLPPRLCSSRLFRVRGLPGVRRLSVALFGLGVVSTHRAVRGFKVLLRHRAWRLRDRGQLRDKATRMTLGSQGDVDVPRRGAAAVTVAGLLATAFDVGLRTNEGYAPAGPTIWPPKPFKETLRTELVPGCIWGLEQVIAFFTVSANVRMTVVRLQDDKLWVCSPISPTRQCISLLNELGEVAHLVVPGTALEHKASLADFSGIYPSASVWVSPGQNTSPFDPSLGSHVDGILGQGDLPPWQNEIEYKVFYVGPPETAGTYAETAFFHRRTKTLLLTDAVLKVPETPPPVLASYGFDGSSGELSLQQWYYKFLAFNFLTMRGSDEADFKALSKPPGIVSPILRFTLYPICQKQAAEWVESVAKWPFGQAIAAHLQSPFPITPDQFLGAFGFLFDKTSSWEPEPAQLENLRSASENLDGPDALKSSIWTRFAVARS